MNEHQALIKSVTEKLKPHYTADLEKGLSSEDAYQKIYPKVVHLVSQDLGINRNKTEFEARDILQKIIQNITI